MSRSSISLSDEGSVGTYRFNHSEKSAQIVPKWKTYKSIGHSVTGTRLIPFKTPIGGKVDKYLPPNKRFNLKILLKLLPKLGMIIDLTHISPNEVYNSAYLEAKGIKYVKIYVPGEMVPSKLIRDDFNHVVRDFCRNNEDNEKLIGVHCAHGVNRTGFLICNYMITEMGMNPEYAIQTFTLARGHRIERRSYVKALKKLTCPETTKISLADLDTLYRQTNGPFSPRKEDSIESFNYEEKEGKSLLNSDEGESNEASSQGNESHYVSSNFNTEFNKMDIAHPPSVIQIRYNSDEGIESNSSNYGSDKRKSKSKKQRVNIRTQGQKSIKMEKTMQEALNSNIKRNSVPVQNTNKLQPPRNIFNVRKSSIEKKKVESIQQHKRKNRVVSSKIDQESKKKQKRVTWR